MADSIGFDCIVRRELCIVIAPYYPKSTCKQAPDPIFVISSCLSSSGTLSPPLHLRADTRLDKLSSLKRGQFVNLGCRPAARELDGAPEVGKAFHPGHGDDECREGEAEHGVLCVSGRTS